MLHRVLNLPNIICFWDFQEKVGGSFIARGPQPYRLLEMNGALSLMPDGIFGLSSFYFHPGQWLKLPRAEAQELNIHGKNAQVTIVAWVNWNSMSRCQFVAGMWNETDKKRQYGLFLNLSGRYNSLQNVHGHVSNVGGPTPGEPYCITYATSGQKVPQNEWVMIAMSYDGLVSRAYVDGILEARGRYNPYSYPEGIFDGGENGSDFTVGSCSAGGDMNNFFSGSIGGLAVFNRALEDEEHRMLSTILKNYQNHEKR